MLYFLISVLTSLSFNYVHAAVLPTAGLVEWRSLGQTIRSLKFVMFYFYLGTAFAHMAF